MSCRSCEIDSSFANSGKLIGNLIRKSGIRRRRRKEVALINEKSKDNKRKDNVISAVIYNSGIKINIPKIPKLIPNLVKVAGDNRHHIEVKIFGEKIIALLDNGAQQSVLGNKMIDWIKKRKINISKTNAIISVANKNENKCEGLIDLKIEYNDKVKSFDALLCSAITHDLILGQDFCQLYKIFPAIFEMEVNKKDFFADKIDKIEIELSKEQKKSLKIALDQFLLTTDNFLGKQNLFQHHIDTGNNRPVVGRIYNYSPEVTKKLHKKYDKWERLRIIRKCISSWRNAMIPVPKGDDVRPCLDARPLNKITEPDHYPMPSINRIVQNRPKAKYFCTFDLSEAFLQTELDSESQSKTAFAIPGRGTYCFERMPMGLKNSAASQSRLMDMIIGCELEPYVWVYLDDIIVMAESIDHMISLIHTVAKKLRDANLSLNPSKVEIFTKEVKFLGYILNEKGLTISNEKIKPILNFQQPKTKRSVRRFIGMAGWYHRFIPNFSETIAPLTDLTSGKNTKIVWNEKAEKAFTEIKTKLSTEPVLASADFEKEFTLQTDASDIGIGGVLTQKDDNNHEHVIAYYSKKLTKAEQKYTTTEKECLAALRSTQFFRPYVEMRHFKLITDHHSLVWLNNLKDPNGRLSRWSLQMQQYDFEIIHRPGKMLVVPDALSRAFEDETENCEISAISVQDQWYTDLYQRVESDSDKYPNYRIEDNKLLRNIGFNTDITRSNWRYVVPKSKRFEILRKSHEEAGHFGFAKTYSKICVNFWWPKLYVDVKKHIKSCNACAESKPANYTMRAPMGEARIPKVFNEIISMDFKGPLIRSTKGNLYILVLTDHLTKFVSIYPMKSTEAKGTIKILDKYFLQLGVPRIIIHDNATYFTSNLFTEFLEQHKVAQMKTPRYHAQANPTERVNRTLSETISAYIENDHKQWESKIDEISCAINSSVHETTKFTPYELVFGMKMRNSGEDHKENLSIGHDEKIEHLKVVRDIVREHMQKSHEKNKEIYDKRTRERKLLIGQQVQVRNFKLSNAANNYSAGIARNFKSAIVTQINGGNRYGLTAMNGQYIGIYDINDIKS